MLHSSKVVVFDVRIPIKLALYALAEHGINTAPLWDPFLHDYVGMITPVRPSPILQSPGAQCPPSPRRLYRLYLNLHLTPLCVHTITRPRPAHRTSSMLFASRSLPRSRKNRRSLPAGRRLLGGASPHGDENTTAGVAGRGRRRGALVGLHSPWV